MTSFTELNLSAPLLKSIQAMGFEKPSPIQAETLPILLGESTDFLGLAATGTGKTAAFAIPMLERIDASKRAVQALILCPTRELALQVAGQVNDLGRHKGVRSVAVYGGSSFGLQVRELRDGATVVIGTPGRVLDHLERGTLTLEGLQTIIFDEADEMISMGFKDDLELILKKIPMEQARFWMFSATMSPEVRRVGDTYLRNPKHVQLNNKEVLPSTVEQYFYPVKESDKAEVLCKLIEAADDFYGLVFCQTKLLVSDLTIYMKERGFQVECLHGDMDQTSRERTMNTFRDRRVKILVCTDVASRGLDVKDITHVINYSLPRELDNYVHRIGRTARSGKKGVAMNLVTFSHRQLIYRIERMTKSQMLEGRIPGRREIAAKKVAAMLPKFADQPYQQRAQEVLSPEWSEAIANMTPQEVAARFLAMTMPDLFNDRDPGDHQRIVGHVDRDGDRRDDRRGGGYQRRDDRQGGRGFDRGERPRFDRDNRFDDRKPRFNAEKPKFQNDDLGLGRNETPKFEKRAEAAPAGDIAAMVANEEALNVREEKAEAAPKFERKERFDRGDKPRFEDRKPRFEGDRPRFDGKPRFDKGDKPYGRRFEDGDKPRFRDREDRFSKPRFDNGDRPYARRFEDGDKPRFDRDNRIEGKPRFDKGDKPYGRRFENGDKPRFDRDGRFEDRKPRFNRDGDAPRFDGGEKRPYKNYKEGFKAEGGKFRRDGDVASPFRREQRDGPFRREQRDGEGFFKPPFKRPFKKFDKKDGEGRFDKPPRRFSKDN